MGNSIVFKTVPLTDLILDKQNPRFGKLYQGSESEKDLIDYLLFNEAASEVAKSISKTQKFYEDKALWVLEKDDKYLVKDGNRRCASLKALLNPGKYSLTFKPFNIGDKVPVYVYKNEEELNKRISEEHAGSLFRRWERIAKAIEVYRLHKLDDDEGVKHLDSNPGDLIRLAMFYEEAVKVGGEDLNILLRRGRGDSGGKTIIFERMFRHRKKCGYNFGNAPKYGFKTLNKDRFEDYINCMVELLKKRGSEITTDTIDKGFTQFKKLLKEYGFDIDEKFDEDLHNNNQTNTTYDSSSGVTSSGGTSSSGTSSSGTSSSGTSSSGTSSSGTSSSGTSSSGTSSGGTSSSGTSSGGTSSGGTSSGETSSGETSSGGTNSNRYSRLGRPKPKRKGIRSKITKLITECYSLDEKTNPNAKLSLCRVTFECVMKYIVEETKKSNEKLIKDSKNIRESYFDKQGKPRKYVDFDLMKTKFTNSINDSKIKNAFSTFDLNLPHQIIHNYLVEATPEQALTTCNNLIPLIDFMLQDEQELLNSLDITKL